MPIGTEIGGQRSVAIGVDSGLTQQIGSSGRGIPEILGIGHTIAVAVDAVDRPGRGKELHRTHRGVTDRVAVESAPVGVGNGTGDHPAERHVTNRRGRAAVGQQARIGTDPGVIRGHTPEATEHRPIERARCRCRRVFVDRDGVLGCGSLESRSLGAFPDRGDRCR